jgi:hypothetical protein
MEHIAMSRLQLLVLLLRCSHSCCCFLALRLMLVTCPCGAQRLCAPSWIC